jgi:hypothetical protein
LLLDRFVPLQEGTAASDTDSVVLMTKDKEQYQCIVPFVLDKKQQVGHDNND